MRAFILPILKNPITNKALFFDVNADHLVDDQSEIFAIEDNVPILLPKKDNNYQKHYEQDSLSFNYFTDADKSFAAENKRLHQNILHNLDAKGIILDVGCGNAWLAKELNSPFAKVVSMDISRQNPKQAMKKVNTEYHQAIVADANYLPFRKNSFDVIVASEIIEHVEDPKHFITNLLDVLKPSGKLIITTPYDERISKSLCIHCNKLTPHDAHLHSFNRRKILNLLPADLFKVETKIFNSKLLINTRIFLLINFLPFLLWDIIDRTCNLFFPKKARRLLLKITK